MSYKEYGKAAELQGEKRAPQWLEALRKPRGNVRANGAASIPHEERVQSTTISVVIRTLNEAKMLGLVLESLHSQTLEPREVIVVDSGSTDGTLRIAEEHGATIIPIARERFSYGRALNIGFAASGAEIVVALSGHAVPTDREWMRKLLRNFQNPRVAAVASRLIPYPRTALHNHWLSLPFYLHRAHRTNDLWLFWNTATAYRRDSWSQLPFDEEMSGCEDREWALRAIKQGFEVAYEPEATVWHSHDESYGKFFERVIFTTKMSHKYR